MGCERRRVIANGTDARRTGAIRLDARHFCLRPVLVVATIFFYFIIITIINKVLFVIAPMIASIRGRGRLRAAIDRRLRAPPQRVEIPHLTHVEIKAAH